MWRATGQPGQGAIPTVVATCNNTTVGTIGFNQQMSPSTSYGAYLEIATGNAAMTMELHDRLANMGGLNGTLTTAQSVNLDLNTLLSISSKIQLSQIEHHQSKVFISFIHISLKVNISLSST